MALAILRFQETDGIQSRFQVDIGTNRFYAYAIGNNELKDIGGIKQLKQPKFTSNLIGPIPEESLGRAVLEVPNEHFDRQNRYIQIMSFRTEKAVGPAISEIISVVVTGANRDDASAISLGMETAMERQPIETVAFAYREVKSVSSAMGFLDTLKSIIPKVLPAVKKMLPVVAGVVPTLLPIVGQLIGGGTQADKDKDDTAKGGKSLLIQSISDPKTAELIAALLLQASGQSTTDGKAGSNTGNNNGDSNGNKTGRNSTLAELAEHIAKISASKDTSKKEENQEKNGGSSTSSSDLSKSEASQLSMGWRSSRATAFTLTKPPQYVHEMAIPALLLEALPALIPLLEKVLTPETIKTLAENLPTNKLLGAITDGLKEAGRVSLESQKETLAQLREITPKTDIPELFKELSLGLAAPTVALDYQRVEAVKLQFTDLTTLMIQGRSRLVYRYDQEISFPLTIETPRPIPKGIVQLLVKNPSSLEVLIEQQYPVENVTSGSLTVVPKLSPEQLKALTPNEEYLVSAVLMWTGRSKQTQKKQRVGTSMSQLMTLVGEYSFDRVEGTAEVIPLNDVHRFRPYWHKVWQGSFSESGQQVVFDCKYYYTLEPDRTNHARIETVTQIEQVSQTRQEGRMKTGLILSPHRLNEILPQTSEHPSLEKAELVALLSSEFKPYFSFAARTQVEFKGNKSDSVAMWVYPEFKLQRLILKQATHTNENGHVLELSEHSVIFPMPAVAHFIGVSK